MDDNEPLDFLSKIFCFVLGTNSEKWKNFFRVSLKSRTNLNMEILSYAAHYMVKNFSTAFFDELFDSERTAENLADSNAQNMQKIINLIWKNSWEKDNWNCDNWGNLDWYKEIIYSNDFKEICRTPIYLPIFYCGFLSGEYLLSLLHFDVTDNKKILKIKWKKNHTESGNEKSDSAEENYSDKWRRFFSCKNGSNCYQQQFEEVLSVSFEKFEAKNYRQKAIMRDLFEWYGYIEYDLYNKKPHLKNLLAEVFKNPYLSGGSLNVYLTEKMKFPNPYQGMLLLKTLLLQNINFSTQSRINDIVIIINKLRFDMELFVGLFRTYLANITRAEIMQPHKGLKKFDELVTDFQHCIEEKIYEIPKLKKSAKNEVAEIQATHEEFYTFVFVKIILREIQALKSTYENTFILSPKIFYKYDQVRLYCEINPNEKIEVEDWETFREKYFFQLKKFFPEVTGDEEMKKYWSCAVNVLVFCFPARFGLVISEKTVPKVISVKWLRDHGVDIGEINTAEIFWMLSFIIYSKDFPIKLKGDSTAFYQYILDETNRTIEDRTGLLFVDALKKIQKHYLSKQKTTFNEVLTFQIIWWLSEQGDSFLLTKETIEICRKFLMSVLTAMENILKFEDLEFCLTELKNLNSWLHCVGNEIFNEKCNMDFQKIFQVEEEKLHNIRIEFYKEILEMNKK